MLKFSLIKNVRKAHQPKYKDVAKYTKLALIRKYNSVYIDILIVSSVRSRELNLEYRNKDYPTNVISLEYSDTREQFNILQGELILCDDVIVKEAKEQGKSIISHYTHMIIHGILHLQGLDHKNPSEAKHMESLEIKILQELGFQNPYNL